MDARSVIGIDLTTSEWKPTACAVLDSGGALAWLSKNTSDVSIIELALRHAPAVVAIDSPLSFPMGMDCLDESHACESVHNFMGRACERELRISQNPQVAIYTTTKKTMNRDMILRAIPMAKKLRALGMEVIEVYPYASKRALFGKALPKGKKSDHLKYVVGEMKPLIRGLESAPDNLDNDLLDAIVAAYTARLYIQGRTSAYGIPEEGVIHAPHFVESGEV